MKLTNEVIITMHYYKFNIADWSLHTSHLSLIEEAIYFRLVNYYYDTEKPIPHETHPVIRRLRLETESASVSVILDEFFTLKDGQWFHSRCEKEIKDFKKKAKTNKSNGAKGGRPRKDKGLEGNPETTQTVSENNPDITLTTNYKPLTTNQEPVTNKQVIKDLSRFAEFWNLYAKKNDSKKCEAKFKKLTKTQIDLIFEKLPAYVKSTPDKQYRKNPITWLNNESWNDEVQTSTGQGRDINEIGTDFSQPEGFKKMKFNEIGEMIGYE
jgi:uncharacterized protein YdaU (DUF1376 family)